MQRQELIWVAYHAEMLARSKKLPKLETILRRLTKPQRKTWQQQMAVMDQWSTVMKNIQAKKKK